MRHGFLEENRIVEAEVAREDFERAALRPVSHDDVLQFGKLGRSIRSARIASAMPFHGTSRATVMKYGLKGSGARWLSAGTCGPALYTTRIFSAGTPHAIIAA